MRLCDGLVVALMISSCASPPADSLAREESAKPSVGGLRVLPGSATLAVGDSMTLRVEATADGDDTSVASAVVWQSANAEIARVSPRGVVRAVSQGLAGISARRGNQVAIAQIIVVPRDRGIAQRGVANAPVSDSGARQARRPATDVGQGKGAAPATSPRSDGRGRPNTGALSHPNEPEGFTVIVDRPFRTKIPFIRRGEYPSEREKALAEGFSTAEARSAKFTIVRDPTAPTGDSLVAQMFYSATHRAGTGPATVTMPFPPGIKSAYISIWAKLSSNWVGNESSTNKMFFFGTAGGNNQFFFSAHGRDRGRLIPNLMWQGVIGADRNRQRSRRPNVSPNTGQEIVRGVWQHWEFLFTCNSSKDVFDGTADLWIDGQHVTTAKDISWFRGRHPDLPCQMTVFNWNPTYGGGGASPGEDQYLWFDHVYISGR